MAHSSVSEALKELNERTYAEVQNTILDEVLSRVHVSHYVINLFDPEMSIINLIAYEAVFRGDGMSGELELMMKNCDENQMFRQVDKVLFENSALRLIDIKWFHCQKGYQHIKISGR